MCGRYADAREEEIVEAYDVHAVSWHGPPSVNVCPTDVVGIVIEDGARAAREGAPAVRELRPARWGLVPSWSKAMPPRPLINARAETLAEKPSFRVAAARRRAIVPALGYYEWATDATGRKTPFFLHPEAGGVIGFAGVYEWWRPPEGVAITGMDDGWLCSMAIVTRPAMDAIGAIHDRMPVVVSPDLVDDWLDPGVADVAGLLAAIPDPALTPSPATDLRGPRAGG